MIWCDDSFDIVGDVGLKNVVFGEFVFEIGRYLDVGEWFVFLEKIC